MAAAKSIPEKAQADKALTESLTNLIAVAEAYPQLKANENYLKLQEELASTENKIAYARQFYNEIVQRYETLRQSFPANIIAGTLNQPKREYFNA